MTTRKPKGSKERRITVSSIYRDYRDDQLWLGSRRFPFVRFGGAWLEQAGFAVGQRIRMQVRKGRIIIEPAT